VIDVKYLKGNIYHITHFDNLQSIFQEGALFSKAISNGLGITHHSIANQNVQSRRDRIFIWDLSEQRYRSLHSYIPFYFATRPPMLYVLRDRGLLDQLVIIEVSRMILTGEGILFTDGNATNQKLSKDHSETVYITPKITIDGSCYREYRPYGRPYGANINRSDFYGDVYFLNYLKWDVINDTHKLRIEDKGEYTRIRAAEALIPDSLALSEVQSIAVKTKVMWRTVNALIEQYKLKNHVPPALLKPDMFL